MAAGLLVVVRFWRVRRLAVGREEVASRSRTSRRIILVFWRVRGARLWGLVGVGFVSGVYHYFGWNLCCCHRRPSNPVA